jgi:hypothetical protein
MEDEMTDWFAFANEIAALAVVPRAQVLRTPGALYEVSWNADGRVRFVTVRAGSEIEAAHHVQRHYGVAFSQIEDVRVVGAETVEGA